MIRGDIISITACYGLDDGRVGFRVLVGSNVFASSYRPNRLWGLSSFLLNGYGAPSPGVKQQGREADHSTPTSAEVKKTWICTLTYTDRHLGGTFNTSFLHIAILSCCIATLSWLLLGDSYISVLTG
jgi:hypothetical protein